MKHFEAAGGPVEKEGGALVNGSCVICGSFLLEHASGNDAEALPLRLTMTKLSAGVPHIVRGRRESEMLSLRQMNLYCNLRGN